MSLLGIKLYGIYGSKSDSQLNKHSLANPEKKQILRPTSASLLMNTKAKVTNLLFLVFKSYQIC